MNRNSSCGQHYQTWHIHKYVCYREDSANVHAAGLYEEDKASEVTNGIKTVGRNVCGKQGKL